MQVGLRSGIVRGRMIFVGNRLRLKYQYFANYVRFCSCSAELDSTIALCLTIITSLVRNCGHCATNTSVVPSRRFYGVWCIGLSSKLRLPLLLLQSSSSVLAHVRRKVRQRDGIVRSCSHVLSFTRYLCALSRSVVRLCFALACTLFENISTFSHYNSYQMVLYFRTDE